MNKTLNFDRFLAEKNNETIEVTIYGSTYKVPARIPAIVPVMMARSEDTPDAAVSMKLIFKAADALLGADVVTEICSKGLAVDDLAQLVKNLFDLINGAADDTEQELTDEDSRRAADGGKKKA